MQSFTRDVSCFVGCQECNRVGDFLCAAEATRDVYKRQRFVITVDADYEGEETFELVENIRNTVNTYYPDSYYLAGSGVSTYDLMDTITCLLYTSRCV